MAKIQRLRPQDSSKPYSLADLDAELVSMAMIRALGEDYAQFASSLILLTSLDKKELKAAFLAEETQRRRRADALGASSGDSALVSATGAPPSSYTGATSHMTPHRHYICNYTPKRVPIRLADSTIVYSAGVGSVVFNPVSVGEVKSLRAVEFTRVLHVPDLHNNLLSVLY
ncbi:hypothetical protein BDR03DRAFT_1016848 [Suillus americanus]|nr:hypothetical protein BDR03DRAFT_1016848 [Suillus americanus]